jgi:hypothetical protein
MNIHSTGPNHSESLPSTSSLCEDKTKVSLNKHNFRAIHQKIVKTIFNYLDMLSNNPDVTVRSYRKLKMTPLIKSLEKGVFSKTESIILNDLLARVSEKQFIEILKGAHIRIEGDELYQAWSKLPDTRARISSHPSVSGSVQIGVASPFSHEILFGIVSEGGKTYTFIQLENTPWATGLSNRVNHTLDAIEYIVSRCNVGPYGVSSHTDKNPIIIK